MTMKDFLTVKTMTIPDFAGRIVTIHSVPHNYKDILKFTKLADIPYRGEGLPNITLKTLLKLLRPERKNPSTTTRAEIILEQGGKCAKCGTECKLEMDHIHQISIDPFNRNGKDNLQGLCAECHMEKTMSQGSTPDHNPMMSYFNNHT